uniref:Protein krueppel n=1 Tax=Stomoxys calcitrans TaxID=35570 RepID=A0A1I8Q058_STOCA
MTLVLKVNCRACSRECGDYKHLLDETLIDDEATTLAALLNYCTTIECFDENDALPLPEHICNSCVEHLLQAYLFKEMVLENDRMLRENLKLELEASKSNEVIIREVNMLSDRKLESQSQEMMEESAFVEQEIDVGGAEEENLKDFLTLDEQNDNEDNDDEHQEEDSQKEIEDVVEYEMEEWLDIEDGTITATSGVVETEQQDVGHDQDEEDDVKSIKIENSQRDNEDDTYILGDGPYHSDSQDDSKDSKNENTQHEQDDEEEEDDKKPDDGKKSRKRFLKSGGLTEDDLKCQYCGKQFDKMCRLREHTYVHTGEKPHECKICGKRSRTKTHYNVHMLTHSEEKRYRCSICGQHYRTSTSLRVHERKHSDIRPYACTICDKSFHTAEQKKLHIMIHTGERPFSCNICGKAYRESHSLKQHFLTHGDKKPFECEICGKGLTQMSGYKRHMLLHTNEYPYTCDVCGRPFRISSNLVAHKRLHLDVMPYQCSLCDKGFNNTTRLKRHMAQHEKETVKETNKPRRPRQETIIVDTKMCKSRVVEII